MGYDRVIDARGRPSLAGKTRRTLRWDVLQDTTLPSWLTLAGTGGTVTVVPIGTTPGEGYCELANSTANATAEIQFVFGSTGGVHLDKFEEIEMRIFDLRFASVSNAGSDLGSGVSFGMGVHTYPSRGHFYYQSGDQRRAYLRSYVGGTAQEKNVQAYVNDTGFVGTSCKNLGLIIRRDSRKLFVTGGDDNIHDFMEVTTTGAWPTSAQAIPKIELKSLNTSANWLRFSGIEISFVTG